MRFWSMVRSYPWVVSTLLVLVATLLLEFTGMTGPARWLATGFGAVIVLYTAVGMVRDLVRGHWGIDILAVTAIGATLLVGEYLAALVVCLMLTGGEALEGFAAGRAKLSLTSLLERAPQVAHRLDPDGGAQDVPLEQVDVGERLLIRPAEVVPVDGTLVAAADGADVQADFDESSLTGESLPVTRRTGDQVLSGALNGQQAVVLQATARPEDSQYARILSLVREASESRAPMVRLADRYAVPFTLVAYLIGGIAWWVSQDPVRFAEVLVVATPCPLLIAAPVAFLGGMSRAAANGVIVKSGGIIEALGSVRTVAFDKTGTLTYGRPELLETRPAGAVDGAARLSEKELLRLAGSAEQYSVHVLADSIRRAAEDRGLSLITASEAWEEATNGVTAVLDGRTVIVGKSAYVREHTTGLELAELSPGESAVYVGVDGDFAGTLILSDRLRANAADTLAELDRLGVKNRMMLTGDAEATGHHIAAQAGITDVEAELLPEDKVRLVRQARPGPVMMVGDGVNDAPVLAVADVGVAMGARGSTAASETADVVIIRDDISRSAVAVSVGQRTLRVAKESIWAGIALSLVLMVTAAFGVIPAIVGALFQELVDVVAIANSLRAMRAGRNELQDFAALRDDSAEARAEITVG
ncbi:MULTISPECIES: heavy metal translocating P-type ATPase [Micrococcaceae]|uniref:heavy metal translocating P-type ATPase n=1 Tax=Micrococcaceae TaxID=1268 RepID=UPI001846EC2B|nr:MULTISPECIES: heavy metal translocating P-type ATPase [Micrococcaceae]MBB5747874.1 heavy metal translocating P-type ATPase [Micrococcus sp. TA1]HRO30053.1 heavy metal translocating P-type ATPase [Citricoccus sp.]HRO94630.1 heavy metal translocating P-type ATPase [Citricoccus sp.]